MLLEFYHFRKAHLQFGHFGKASWPTNLVIFQWGHGSWLCQKPRKHEKTRLARLDLGRGLPSGRLIWLWKITIFVGKIHYQLPFSIAMFVYRRIRRIAIFGATGHIATDAAPPLAEKRVASTSRPIPGSRWRSSWLASPDSKKIDVKTQISNVGKYPLAS